MENGNSTPMYMPVAPAYNNNGGFFGGDMGGGWWLILLVLLMGGGLWGGFGGMGGFSGFANAGMDYLYPWLNNSQHISDGFRDQMLQSSIGDLRNDVTAGFGGVQNALCQGFAGVNAGIANGFAQAEISNNARQIANMQQDFAMQSALQNCCCENRAATADLKYTIATENCADRAAISDGIRDLLAAQTAGIQSIKDQLCQDKIDAKNDEIANLRQQIAMKDLAASQVAQNAFIAQGFTKEVDDLYSRLSSCPVPSTPVFGRTPIFSCGQNAGCGCGGNTFMN